MDPSQDWFLRQLSNLAQGLQEVLHKSDKIEIPQPTNAIGSDDVLPEILKGMVANGEIDKAENLLFRCVENYPLVENYNIGMDFYTNLAAMPPHDLAAAGWSKQEIKEGVADLYELIFQEPLDIKKTFGEEI